MWRVLQLMAFWGFQLAFGTLFSIVFIFAVPQAVDGWLIQGLSIALGGMAGIAVVFGLMIAVMSPWLERFPI